MVIRFRLTKKTIFSRSKQNNHKSIDDSKQKVHNQTKLKETPSIVVQTKANKTFHGMLILVINIRFEE